MTVIPPRVAVVVVRWNHFEDTKETLESISQIQYTNFFVILVDNGSTDGRTEDLRRLFPNINYIINSENIGFAGGANLGVKSAVEHGAEYILFLNNDLYVDKHIIKELVCVAQNDPSIGMVGALMYYYQYPKVIWSAGGQYDMDAGNAKLIGDREKDIGQFKVPFEVDYICGCGMMVRRFVFENVGLWDEGYFHCGEDVDLCIRSTRAGYRVVTAPRARLWHKVASSANGIASPMYLYYRFRNNLILMRKYQYKRSRKHLVYFIADYFINIAKEFKSYNPEGSLAILLALSDFIKGISGKRA